MQLYEHIYGQQFRKITEATSRFQTNHFALLPSLQFLVLLSSPQKMTPTGLELTQEDGERFLGLKGGATKFKEAMKLSRKRKNTTELDFEEED